ncbi:MAG: hypothetical protein K0R71_1020 [Bacillales bacterium]|jgi:ubiquinone/menaquinone biosynthesis C-methylase UbiE|nr:hypothetical protein [Bacillales bacterium]
MSNINNTSVLVEQYKDDKNLSIRLALHQKYSTNKYGYINWIFDFFDFFDGTDVLELGCGNGNMWNDRVQKLPKECTVTLTDISKGMVDIINEKFREYPNVKTEVVDIQNIHYPDNTFDVIIANSMLYHIPNLEIAISEVHRVLKPNGKFYATTVGMNGMNQYLHEKLKEFNPKINVFNTPFPFNLQNGKEILNTRFENIEMYHYEDSLEITETVDLVNWIKSTSSMSGIEEDLNGVDLYFEKCKDSNGIIRIPKEAGIFVSTK